jgi:iron complex outermembrane receptor protein
MINKLNETLQEGLSLLISNAYSCVAYCTHGLYTSQAMGIRPLIQPINEDASFFKDAIVIDKVIGKSAALLLIYGQAQAVHAQIISEHALKRLKDSKIIISYDKVVPFIQNNERNGMCPMEATVLNIEDPYEGLLALKLKIQELMALKTSK